MLTSLRFWLRAGCLVLSTGFTAAHADEQSDVVSYSDPWEKVNRVSYSLNAKLDSWVLRPVAKGYDSVTPKPIQGVVSNFFQNVGEIRNVTNALLQLRLRDAGVSTARFLLNSTVGMLGMLDVGTAVGLQYRYNDFGITLARWHVPSGPYVVLPLLGASTLRSATGIVPDFYLNPVNEFPSGLDRGLLWGTEVVNLRAGLFPKEKLLVGDKYTFTRDAYLQRRVYLITGKVPEDDF